MVAVIFDVRRKTLKIAETPDNLENLIGVTRIYGVASITHGAEILGKGHWLKGFDINGEMLCLITNVWVLEHAFKRGKE